MSPSAIALIVAVVAIVGGLLALATDNETPGGCLLIVGLLAVIVALLVSRL